MKKHVFVVSFAGALALFASGASAATFNYYFSSIGTLNEAGAMHESSSPYFWLNSGGLLGINGTVGKTNQGSLSASSRWRLLYAAANPVDTDNGYHPQNLFRLVTKSKWQNASQEVDFKINKLQLSSSPNRNNSNGILFFNRQIDTDNLYYTGIRVDGNAVIKKKIDGKYFTMALNKFLPGTYNRDTNPTLLPVGAWMALKSEVLNNEDGTVTIRVFIDMDNSGNWLLAAEAIDNGTSYGGAAFRNEGYAGIRTDFMDVEFDNYRLAQ